MACDCDGLSGLFEGNGRRLTMFPPSCGIQFSLSESPEGDPIRVGLDLFDWDDTKDGFPVPCSLARLELALPSFGLFSLLLESRRDGGALRLLLLDLRAELLEDRSKLIAATAEPLDSCSACVVSSSRASESQKNSQFRASLDRPLGSRGMTGLPPGGSRCMGPNEIELRLRWRPRIGCRGIIAPDDEGRPENWRIGDRSAATSSAFPSRDIDKRTLADGATSFDESIRSGHEDGKVG